MTTLYGQISNDVKGLGTGVKNVAARRIAKTLSLPVVGNDPNVERLMNIYSLIGPNNINNKYVPHDVLQTLFAPTYYKGTTPQVIENFENRTGLYPQINGLNLYNNLRITPDDLYRTNVLTGRGVPDETSYNVLSGATPISYGNNLYGIKGTFNSTLPDVLKQFTHPVNYDLRAGIVNGNMNY